jgi:hypothetical protein
MAYDIQFVNARPGKDLLAIKAFEIDWDHFKSMI